LVGQLPNSGILLNLNAEPTINPDGSLNTALNTADILSINTT